jgi:hypothetical protein
MQRVCKKRYARKSMQESVCNKEHVRYTRQKKRVKKSKRLFIRARAYYTTPLVLRPLVLASIRLLLARPQPLVDDCSLSSSCQFVHIIICIWSVDCGKYSTLISSPSSLTTRATNTKSSSFDNLFRNTKYCGFTGVSTIYFFSSADSVRGIACSHFAQSSGVLPSQGETKGDGTGDSVPLASGEGL